MVKRGQASLSIGSLVRLARAIGLGELARVLEPYDGAGNGGGGGRSP